MGFGQAILAGFTGYVNFRDRACRSEYWYWTLFTAIGTIVATFIDVKLNPQFANGLFQLVTFIPTLAIAVRRLHDIDRRGWWFLIGLIPLLGGIILLIWFTSRGTDGPNRFGPDPLAAEEFPNQQSDAPT